jgi:transposase
MRRMDSKRTGRGAGHGPRDADGTGPELGTLTRRQISALVGVAPCVRQSGQWQGQRFCSGGRGAVRTMLYMAAFSAIKHNPAIRQFYTRLIERGKPFKVAMVACMRKLLSIMNTLVKKKEKWTDKMLQNA